MTQDEKAPEGVRGDVLSALGAERMASAIEDVLRAQKERACAPLSPVDLAAQVAVWFEGYGFPSPTAGQVLRAADELVERGAVAHPTGSVSYQLPASVPEVPCTAPAETWSPTIRGLPAALVRPLCLLTERLTYTRLADGRGLNPDGSVYEQGAPSAMAAQGARGLFHLLATVVALIIAICTARGGSGAPASPASPAAPPSDGDEDPRRRIGRAQRAAVSLGVAWSVIDSAMSSAKRLERWGEWLAHLPRPALADLSLRALLSLAELHTAVRLAGAERPRSGPTPRQRLIFGAVRLALTAGDEEPQVHLDHAALESCVRLIVGWSGCAIPVGNEVLACMAMLVSAGEVAFARDDTGRTFYWLAPWQMEGGPSPSPYAPHVDAPIRVQVAVRDRAERDFGGDVFALLRHDAARGHA